MPKNKKQKQKQVNFRLDAEQSTQLDGFAERERRKRNDLARLLFNWAFECYQEAGSVERLYGLLESNSKRTKKR